MTISSILIVSALSFWPVLFCLLLLGLIHKDMGTIKGRVRYFLTIEVQNITLHRC